MTSPRLTRGNFFRRTMGLTSLSVLCGTGCSEKVKRILVAVARTLVKVGNVVVDLVNLTHEITAIIDGKEEIVPAQLTREEADALKQGGKLVIKGEDGKEFPVEYKTK